MKVISAEVVRKDILASVVVFLVALPLCMGIAIASGAPPAAGLMTGIIGGLVVGFIAGSPLQVSGPAAGLSVIVYELIQQHGLATLGVIVLAAGAIQVIAGALRLGQWFRAVSPAVIQGMLAGIGVLIFSSQFHVMVDDSPRSGGLANLISIPVAIWKGLGPMGSQHQIAAIVGLATMVAIAGWSYVPGRLKSVPAPLVAVVVGTLMAMLFGLSVKKIDVPASLIEAVTLPAFADFGILASGSIIVAVLTMAIVASAETLLCATAVDQMHNGPRTNYDRELAAQGIGNMLCGIVGALPMTGVIVRSSANVTAGARTRLSAIMHSVWLLVFVAALPFVLQSIPTAALAAILVYTGYKLMNFKAIPKLASYGRSELAIFFATVAGVVAIDLLSGVLIGLGLSMAKLIYTFSHLEIHKEMSADEDRTTLRLVGAATVVRLPFLAETLEATPADTELHVNLEGLDYIDHACLNLLMEWEKQHEAQGGRLVIDWTDLTARFRSQRPLVERKRAPGAPVYSESVDASIRSSPPVMAE
ncbi:MAG: SulP family inorganic anion transporter [Phycisphaerales bacterium]|nr:SulP family inorganic anion transporter [Phycisphaerales bacterium]